MKAYDALTRISCTRMNLMIGNQVDSTLENVRLLPGAACTQSLLRTVHKARTAYANPTPSLTAIPFLRDSQQAILGSLATASALRGFGR